MGSGVGKRRVETDGRGCGAGCWRGGGGGMGVN